MTANGVLRDPADEAEFFRRRFRVWWPRLSFIELEARQEDRGPAHSARYTASWLMATVDFISKSGRLGAEAARFEVEREQFEAKTIPLTEAAERAERLADASRRDLDRLEDRERKAARGER